VKSRWTRFSIGAGLSRQVCLW